jgi:hypothetical protein
MNKSSIVLALTLLLGACGEQGAQTPSAPAGGEAAAPASAPADQAAEAPAPAPAAAAPEAPAAEEDLKYDPIDVSKLDNSWYKQYSGGQ